MKAQKAKMTTFGVNFLREMKAQKRPKCKEMKAQKAKMKGNAAGLAADEICLNLIRKRTVFGNLWGGPTRQPRQAKNKRK